MTPDCNDPDKNVPFFLYESECLFTTPTIYILIPSNPLLVQLAGSSLSDFKSNSMGWHQPFAQGREVGLAWEIRAGQFSRRNDCLETTESLCG